MSTVPPHHMFESASPPSTGVCESFGQASLQIKSAISSMFLPAFDQTVGCQPRSGSIFVFPYTAAVDLLQQPGQTGSACIFTSPAGAVAKYCDEYVCPCVSVCLSARISLEPQARSLPNFCACCLRRWCYGGDG